MWQRIFERKCKKMRRLLKILFYLSFIVYLIALINILFVGTRGFGFAQELTLIEYIRTRSNIVPFKTIMSYIDAFHYGTMNRDVPIKNLIGNFILFLPMSIYLPIIFNRLNSFKKCIITILSILFLVEVTQLVFKLGAFDIDDLILNLLGVLLGFSIYKLALHFNIIKHLKV